MSAKKREKAAFIDVATRLTRAADSDEQKRLKEELARMTFGKS